MENQMKVNEISKLEKFNKSLVYTIKNIDENKSKESTLIGNLRGILSPR